MPLLASFGRVWDSDQSLRLKVWYFDRKRQDRKGWEQQSCGQMLGAKWPNLLTRTKNTLVYSASLARFLWEKYAGCNFGVREGLEGTFLWGRWQKPLFLVYRELQSWRRREYWLGSSDNLKKVISLCCDDMYCRYHQSNSFVFADFILQDKPPEACFTWPVSISSGI